MKIAFLTSGGIAPCLSASVARLTDNYLNQYPDAEIIGYLNGYKAVQRIILSMALYRSRCLHLSQSQLLLLIASFNGIMAGLKYHKLAKFDLTMKTGIETLEGRMSNATIEGKSEIK